MRPCSYIENQFFITSTVVEGNTVENKIGEALVDRIIRAHRDGTPWRAIIVIPLIPGFPMPIDHPDASSVRLIVECQNRSICRGEHSIFAKLRREGIDPDEYINFFSLRTWGKLRGGQLTTEQVYIHGKVMVVDDRLALIGSANINERSQRGDRDSELACVIRDTDMIDSTMGGQPFKVGRFAHTLRVRLMREHLGVDVDEMEAEEVNMDMMDQQPSEMQDEEDGWDPDHEQERDTEAEGTTHVHPRHTRGQYRRMAADLATDISSGVGVDVRNMMADHHRVEDVAEKLKGDNDYAGDTPKKEDDLSEKTRTERVRQIAAGKNKGQTEVGFDSSVVPTLEEKVVAEDRPVKPAPERSAKERKEMMDKKVYPRPGPVHATSSHDVADGSGLANGKPQDREGGPEDPKTTQEGAYDAEKKAKQDPSTTAAQGDRAKQDGRQQKESQRYANNSESIHRVSSGVTFESQGSESGRTEATKTEVTEEELRRKMSNKMSSNPWAPPTGAPGIDPHNFADPLTDQFFKVSVDCVHELHRGPEQVSKYSFLPL